MLIVKQIINCLHFQINEEKILPGSSQPQDLGSISYKDTETNEENQQTQSADTTSFAIVTETFQTEEKFFLILLLKTI